MRLYVGVRDVCLCFGDEVNWRREREREMRMGEKVCLAI